MKGPLLRLPHFFQKVLWSLRDCRRLLLQVFGRNCHPQVLRVSSFLPNFLHQTQFICPFASCFSTNVVVHHPVSKRAGQLRKFSSCLQLCQILFFLVLDVGKRSLELLSILVQVVLCFLFQFPVNLPPVFRVTRLVGFVLPVRYIAPDEVQPYLGVSADDLGRVYFNLVLQTCGEYLKQGCYLFTHELFRALDLK